MSIACSRFRSSNDRELPVVDMARAGASATTPFRSAGPLLRATGAHTGEIMLWTASTAPHASESHRSRLVPLYKGQRGITALVVHAWSRLIAFCTRHSSRVTILPRFTLRRSIRPSVLTAFYRASGDLRQVKAIANHAHLSTTVGYVEGAEVEAQNR